MSFVRKVVEVVVRDWTHGHICLLSDLPSAVSDLPSAPAEPPSAVPFRTPAPAPGSPERFSPDGGGATETFRGEPSLDDESAITSPVADDLPGTAEFEWGVVSAVPSKVPARVPRRNRLTSACSDASDYDPRRAIAESALQRERMRKAIVSRLKSSAKERKQSALKEDQVH